MVDERCKEESEALADARRIMDEEYNEAWLNCREATMECTAMGLVCAVALPEPTPIGETACALLIIACSDAYQDARDSIEDYHNARSTWESKLQEYQTCLHKTKTASEAEEGLEEGGEIEDGLAEAEEYTDETE